MHPLISCPHCKQTIAVTRSMVGTTSTCVHCNGKLIVNSFNKVQPDNSPDEVDLSKNAEAPQLNPDELDGTDMLKRTESPFHKDGSDINRMIADALPEDPEPDAELSDPSILNRTKADGIVSEVNRILGEED